MNKIIKFSILFIGILLQGIIFSSLLSHGSVAFAQDFNEYPNYNKNGYDMYVYDEDHNNNYYDDFKYEKENNNGYLPEIFDILLKIQKELQM